MSSRIGFPIPPQMVEIPEFWNFIFLSGIITDDVAVDICSKIISVNMINMANNKTEPIQMFINTPGGDIHSSWQICDVMDFVQTPIHTVGVGQVCSAGLLILMNGEYGNRKITDRTSIMSHSYSWGQEGSHEQLMAKTKEFTHVYDRLINHYHECTGLDKQVIKDRFLASVDNWLTAKDAKKFGFIDHVVKSNKTKNIEARKKKNGTKKPIVKRKF